MGIIYKITSPSGKMYIGQTTMSFKRRIEGHKKSSSNCTLLKRAINKYGENMKYEIIEDVSQEQLDEREMYWIEQLNTLAPNSYNCSAGGNENKTLSQTLKDNIGKGVQRSKIKRDGYLGYVFSMSNGAFKPRVCVNGKTIYLSKYGFSTKEEAIQVLKEYTKDPVNFVKVEGCLESRRRPTGCIYSRGSKWGIILDKKYMGTYETKEEAQRVLNNAKSGGITKRVIKKSNGRVISNISKKDDKITSWSFKVYVNKQIRTMTIGSLKTKEEAEEIQKLYNENPDTFQFPSPKKVGNGKGGIYFDKSRGKWQVMVKNRFLGRFESKEKAETVLKEYLKDPENFVKPKGDVSPRIYTGNLYNHGDKWALRYRGKHIGMYDTKESTEKVIKYLNIHVKTKEDIQKVLDVYKELLRVFTTWKTYRKNSLAENRTPIDALTVH